MKACPQCRRLYPSGADFCQADGVALAALSELPQPSDSDDSLVGTVLFDRYQLCRVVADGGMGRVYEAHDQHGDRRVAIKLLHPEVARESVSVERFRREFQVSHELSHPHIVDVIGFEVTPDGGYALVMEFLAGEELRALLKREGTLSPARLVRLLSQVALAMDVAHSLHWVHRDLKPDNIFLCQTEDGELIKVLDFGSVKDRKADAKQLTVMGTTIGSPFYMSPEQAQGSAALDHRADVWAMAAICYECITGQVPFLGPNGPSTLLAIVSSEPEPPSSWVSRSSAELDHAVLSGLAKDPGQRTKSIGDLADAVGHALGLRGSHTEWAGQPEADLEAVLPQDWGERRRTEQESESRMSSEAMDAAFARARELSARVSTQHMRAVQPRTPWVLIGAMFVAAVVVAVVLARLL